jgi:hypothetical protein
MSGWSPEVDLYQLGLTLLQVRLGVHHDGDAGGVEELRELLRSEVNVNEILKSVLLGLTEAQRSRRFQTTGQVLDALDGASRL